MRNIISYFIKYPIWSNVLLAVIILGGWLSLKSMQATFIPLFVVKNVQINVTYLGASPQEIQEGIIIPIQNKIKGIQGIDEVNATALENQASILIKGLDDVDIDELLQDVNNAVSAVNNLPQGAELPRIYKMQNLQDAIVFSIYGKNKELSIKELKPYAKTLEDDLMDIDGISQLELRGVPPEEIVIKVKEQQLIQYNTTFDKVNQAVQNANIQLTGGIIRTEKKEQLIRSKGIKRTAQDFEDIVIQTGKNGQPILLKDVATITNEYKRETMLTYIDGKPCIEFNIDKTRNEDILFINDTVKKHIKNFEKTHPNIKTQVVFDRSITLLQRIDLLSKNGFTGFILVVIVLSFFLHPRIAFWVAFGIPISFLGMFLIAPHVDITINIMSLFGMIIVVGILVDDAIVIAENIYQKYEQGKTPLNAAVEGTMEVLPSVFSAVITTMIAFSPFFFAGGFMGKLIPDMAAVVIITLGLSLLEGIFILPAHIAHSKMMKTSPKETKKNALNKLADKVMHILRDKIYVPILQYAIEYKFITISFFVMMLIITIGAVKGGLVNTTYFPSLGGRSITAEIEMPAGTSFEKTKITADKVLKAIRETNQFYMDEKITPDSFNMIVSVRTTIGSSSNKAKLYLFLLDEEKRSTSSSEISQKVREHLGGGVPEAEKFTIGGRQSFGKPVSIKLQGKNPNTLLEAKKELKNKLKNVPELTDIIDNTPLGPEEVIIELLPKATTLGISRGMIMQQVRQGYFGIRAKRFYEQDDEIEVWLRYDDESRRNIGQLMNKNIKLPTGNTIPLSEVATVHIQRSQLNVNSIDGKQSVSVEANLKNRATPVPEINAKIKKTILKDLLIKYPSISLLSGGQSEEGKKNMSSMKTYGTVAILAILAIVTLSFRSFWQMIVILLTLPFGIVGVVWGHWIHDIPVSILSSFGVIALLGIMINDSLVFVNSFNLKMKEGISFQEAIIGTGNGRFRPIFLTSLTTIAGLGPMVFEKSLQAQFLIPMAISTAYGLLFVTIIALIMLPVLLVYTNDIKYFIAKLSNKNATRESIEPAVKELNNTLD